MGNNRKSFDAVAVMRRSRNRLSRRFKGMTFAEQKREMTKMAKGRSLVDAEAKRRTA